MELTENQFLNAVENMHDSVAIFECRAERKAVYINESFIQDIGYNLDELQDVAWTGLFKEDTDEQVALYGLGNITESQRLQDCLDSRETANITLVITTKIGKEVKMDVSLSYVKNPHGRAMHFMLVMRDATLKEVCIEELAAENERLKQQNMLLQTNSKFDAETGILSKSALDNELKGLFSATKRSGEKFALCVVSINDFASLGHLQQSEKSQVLNHFAGLLKNNMRRISDLVLRYTDEDFILCFTGQEIALAKSFLERLAQMIAEEEFGEVKQKITVSVGVYATKPDYNETLTSFILKADVAMHAARKRADTFVVAANG